MTETLSFDGRVAIVTGAGGGLGRAHALELARRGASVVVNDLPSEPSARHVVSEIEAAGGTAALAPATVTTAAGGRAIVKAALDAFGRVDVLVNNAGNLRQRSFGKLEDADIDATFAVHLHGAFNVTRPVWGLFKDQRYGRILNTTSNVGLLGNFGQSAYGAAKAGLVGLTRVLAIEGSKYGINVNALAPVARTAQSQELWHDVGDKLDPSLVAPVAAWLLHESCTVTGEVYSAVGGRVARFFVGVTPGWYDPALTAESVRDHVDAIRATDGFREHRGVFEELAEIRALWELGS